MYLYIHRCIHREVVDIVIVEMWKHGNKTIHVQCITWIKTSKCLCNDIITCHCRNDTCQIEISTDVMERFEAITLILLRYAMRVICWTRDDELPTNIRYHWSLIRKYIYISVDHQASNHPIKRYYSTMKLIHMMQ